MRVSLVFTTAILLALPLLSLSTPAAVARKPLPTSVLDWNPVAQGGFDNVENDEVACLQSYGPYLYAGTYKGNGCEVWRYDGAAWEKMVGERLPGNRGPGFGNTANFGASRMAVSGDQPYIGVSNGNGCEVWSYDGTAFSKLVGTGLPGNRAPGFGDTDNEGVTLSDPYGAYLFPGTDNEDNGAEVWRFDGASWTKEAAGGIYNPANEDIYCFGLYGSSLYVGTDNESEGAEVWSAGYNFYFAEGYTGASFQEYLCLGNPTATDANVTIT